MNMPTKPCPSCRAENREIAVFCRACGVRIEKAAPGPAAGSKAPAGGTWWASKQAAVISIGGVGLLCVLALAWWLEGRREEPARRAVDLAGVPGKPARRLEPPRSRTAKAGTSRETAIGQGGIEWVSIPGGSFLMGSNGESSEEKPVHRVRVKSFQMAKNEVTFGQYRECVDAGKCTPAHVSDGTCYVYDGSSWNQGTLPTSFQGDDQPAVCVDWPQAKAFSQWAGGRLPSEAEWEYAARSGGRDIKYPWGDESATCARAVMDDGGAGCGRNSTWPVCSKTGGNTSQGLCDMAGNVWEWTQDWYHSYDGAPSDGSAWERPTGSTRVSRGGSWYGDVGDLRAVFRGYGGPGIRSISRGFRPVR